VAVESEVEPGPQMEAGVGDDLDLQAARCAVGHRAVDAPPAQSPVRRVVRELGDDLGDVLDVPVRMLYQSPNLSMLRSRPAEVVEHHEDPVGGAVRSFE